MIDWNTFFAGPAKPLMYTKRKKGNVRGCAVQQSTTIADTKERLKSHSKNCYRVANGANKTYRHLGLPFIPHGWTELGNRCRDSNEHSRVALFPNQPGCKYNPHIERFVVNLSNGFLWCKPPINEIRWRQRTQKAWTHAHPTLNLLGVSTFHEDVLAGFPLLEHRWHTRERLHRHVVDCRQWGKRCAWRET